MCIQEAENNHKQEAEKVTLEKEDLNKKIIEMMKEEEILTAKLESLQADNDITCNQLAAMKGKNNYIMFP